MRGSIALCCLLAAGCSGPNSTTQPVQQRFFAMGTWVDVTFQSSDREDAETALTEIEATLRRLERDYYPWAPGELAELNDAIAADRGIDVSEDLAELLRRARSLSAQRDGCFDPGVGRLVELWGFHSAEAIGREPPTDEALAAALTASGGIAALRIDGRHVSSAATGLKIDLGGIAKGAAIAQIIHLLESRGASAALVNAGGDLTAIGRAPGDRAWRVGIRHPRADGLLGIVPLEPGESAFTSGDYERYYDFAGQRMHHLLDPRTGRPVAHTQALTVIADDPVLADAAATALFVAGPGRWREIATRMGITYVLRVDASGAIETTGPMSARIQPIATDHDMIIGSGEESPP